MVVFYFKRIGGLSLIILTQLILATCSSPTEPELSVFEKIAGQLEADIDHAVLEPDGTVWAWGGNTTGQLGDGTMNPSAIPVKTKKLKDVIAFDLLVGAAVAADIRGDIWFWGNNLLWDEGPHEVVVTVPTIISHLDGIIALEIESIFISLLKNDGTVWQLVWDHREPTKYLEPEKIAGMENIAQISGDIALKKDGRLRAFPERLALQPEKDGLIDSLTHIIQLGNRSRSYTVILKKDSTVWAWGDNSAGYLGNGTLEDSEIPVRVKNIDQIVDISVNGARCLTLKNDGTVWFWGLGGFDHTLGAEIFQNFPVKIEGLEDVQLIKAGGGNRNIVKQADGTYWVFGSINRTPEQVPFDRL